MAPSPDNRHNTLEIRPAPGKTENHPKLLGKITRILAKGSRKSRPKPLSMDVNFDANRCKLPLGQTGQNRPGNPSGAAALDLEEALALARWLF